MSEAESTDERLDPDQELWLRLNGETGRIAWPELQRHFARGVLVVVGQGVDLVATACLFSKDDKEAVERMIADGQIARASDDDAREWEGRHATFWAVVVAPWVLVQEIGH